MYSNDGKLFGFGNNEYYQLSPDGVEKYENPILIIENKEIEMIECGAFYYLIYKRNGDLLAVGDNNYKQCTDLIKEDKIDKLTLIMNIKNLKMISCGYHHTFLLFQDGKALGFGMNSYRQGIFFFEVLIFCFLNQQSIFLFFILNTVRDET